MKNKNIREEMPRIMKKESVVYLNGEFVAQSQAKISVFDQGVLYGDGVFEGLRVYNRRIFKCDEHLDRLYDGAKCLLLEMPLGKEESKVAMIETCSRNGIRDGYIRLVVTRGRGDLSLLPARLARPTIFCIVSKLLLYPLEMYEKGMPIITAMRRRSKASVLDPQVKSLNYLNNILAKIEAVQAGVPEALMLTEDGLVAECAGDNIFIVKDGLIITPPLHVGILNGITRKTVIGLAREMNMELAEKEFTLFNVYCADECFLTGTAAEIVSVRSVDGRTIGNGKPGAITKALAEAFHSYASGRGTPICQEANVSASGKE